MKRYILHILLSAIAFVGCTETIVGFESIEDYHDMVDTKIHDANKIYYTSCDGKIVIPSDESAFGANIVSNEYNGGEGVITFDAPVTTIDSWAFDNCASLTCIIIPNSVVSIGYRAFSFCNSMISVTIPNSVASIGDWAFTCCNSLRYVYCKSITPPVLYGFNVFDTNADDRKIYVPIQSVEKYKEADHWDVYASDIVGEQFVCRELYYTSSNGQIVEPYSKDAFGAKIVSNSYENGRGVIRFDKNITGIGNKAFHTCFKLESITIPDSVTEIGDEAFEYCSSLKDVSIGCCVESIGYEAFHGCSSLVSVTIPQSVTMIKSYAFYYCTSLESIYCKPTTPPAGSVIMFGNNASGRTIYVPNAAVYAYKTADYWKDYSNFIVGE